MKYIHYSGGAEGADIEWDRVGKALLDQQSSHFYIKGYKTPHGNTPAPEEATKYQATPWLIKVNEMFLKRTFPTHSKYVNMLLYRNYLQVIYTDAVYAITSFDRNGIVEGGTAWAVYMAILMNKIVYLFDQNKEKWYVFNYNMSRKAGDGEWIETIDGATPFLTTKYTGIGTRNLNEAGKKAIADVINKAREQDGKSSD